MRRIKISAEGRCAQSQFPWNPESNRKSKDKWLESNDLFLSEAGEVFALVDTPNSVYFMDAITGSLYAFGECLTSDTLKVRGLKRNQAEAAKKLLEFEREEMAA